MLQDRQPAGLQQRPYGKRQAVANTRNLAQCVNTPTLEHCGDRLTHAIDLPGGPAVGVDAERVPVLGFQQFRHFIQTASDLPVDGHIRTPAILLPRRLVIRRLLATPFQRQESQISAERCGYERALFSGMKVLLAVDNSSSSRAAVYLFALRPWPEHASIEVIHVLEPAHLWLTSDTGRELARLSNAVVQDAVALLREAGLSATGRLLEGDPRQAILDRAHETGADWIFAGARGATGVDRWLLGSVSSAVFRHASCSVEIARQPRGPDRDRAAHHHYKILLATDGSNCSELAARSIASRPWPRDTEVRILSVLEFVAPTILGLMEPPGIDFEINAELRAEAMRHAQEAIAAARGIVSARCPQVDESISVLTDRPGKIDRKSVV